MGFDPAEGFDTAVTVVIDKRTGLVEIAYGHDFNEICALCDRRSTCDKKTAGNPCAVFCG